MIKMIPYAQHNIVLGIVKPGRLHWVGPWLSRLTFGWQDLKHEMRPLKIRWGWALLLAIVLVLAMGECGPAVSAIAVLP
ncbi:MAG: hypothetical protein PVH17_02655 [Anaerolineae bacterium]|jgi:hypothetical protein